MALPEPASRHGLGRNVVEGLCSSCHGPVDGQEAGGSGRGLAGPARSGVLPVRAGWSPHCDDLLLRWLERHSFYVAPLDVPLSPAAITCLLRQDVAAMSRAERQAVGVGSVLSSGVNRSDQGGRFVPTGHCAVGVGPWPVDSAIKAPHSRSDSVRASRGGRYNGTTPPESPALDPKTRAEFRQWLDHSRAMQTPLVGGGYAWSVPRPIE